mmetsp:Transcript_12731/g.19740  ORF Transcript_12731/g.19740 Transcript_12731/m.19740 type:complete len:94 (+) Transcript_12731:594-875(+)
MEAACSKNRAHQTLLKNQAKDTGAKIHSIYDRLSALVEERRAAAVSEMEAKLEKELKYLGSRLAEAESTTQALDVLTGTCNQAFASHDHDLLI